MNLVEIFSVLKSIGWEENIEGAQYKKYRRFFAHTATGLEHFYVQAIDGDSYLCLHSRFAEWSSEFKKKSMGITVGGKNGAHILLSSNMTEFKKIKGGGKGAKIYEYFPLRFQQKADVLAAAGVIADKARFIVSTPIEPPSNIPSVTEKVNVGFPKEAGFSELEQKNNISINETTSKTDLIFRKPLTPSEDEEMRKKQVENGALGESLALQYEISRLATLGCETPRNYVQQISLIDVGAGYDIYSSWSGKERFIEVKASERGSDSFFISSNELRVLISKGDRGWIYRVDLSARDSVNGCVVPLKNAGAELSRNGVLEPSQYKATILR